MGWSGNNLHEIMFFKYVSQKWKQNCPTLTKTEVSRIKRTSRSNMIRCNMLAVTFSMLCLLLKCCCVMLISFRHVMCVFNWCYRVSSQWLWHYGDTQQKQIHHNTNSQLPHVGMTLGDWKAFQKLDPTRVCAANSKKKIKHLHTPVQSRDGMDTLKK